jgi:hypothetical protein
MSKPLKDIFPIYQVQYILEGDPFCTYMFLTLCEVVELRNQKSHDMEYQLSFINAFFNSIPNYDRKIYPDRSKSVESFIDILESNCYEFYDNRTNRTNPINRTNRTNRINSKKRYHHIDENPNPQKRLCM